MKKGRMMWRLMFLTTILVTFVMMGTGCSSNTHSDISEVHLDNDNTATKSADIEKDTTSLEEIKNIEERIPDVSIQEQDIPEPVKVEFLSTKELNEILTLMQDNGLRQYSANNVDYGNILSFVKMYYNNHNLWKEESLEAREGRDYPLYYNKLSEDEMNILLNRFFSIIEVPKTEIGSVKYEDEYFLFECHDIGDPIWAVSIAEQPQLLENGNYRVNFHAYHYDYSDEESLYDEKELVQYYTYNRTEMEQERLLENAGYGEAEFCFKDGKWLLTEYCLYENIAISYWDYYLYKGQYVKLYGSLQKDTEENWILVLDQPYTFNSYYIYRNGVYAMYRLSRHGMAMMDTTPIDEYEIETIGLTGNHINADEMVGKRVSVFGEVAENGTLNEGEQVVIIDGLNHLEIVE